jgi:hypothetical protein
MQFGYAHSARRPPAFPDAPPAILVASKSVMLSLSLLKFGWCERKYAVVEPMMPPPEVVSKKILKLKFF